jgi:glutamate racemase
MTHKITEYDALTNETIEREATAKEIAQYEKDVLVQAKAKANAIAEAETKATAKSALLSKLGITQEEANLLLS